MVGVRYTPLRTSPVHTHPLLASKDADPLVAIFGQYPTSAKQEIRSSLECNFYAETSGWVIHPHSPPLSPFSVSFPSLSPFPPIRLPSGPTLTLVRGLEVSPLENVWEFYIAVGEF